MSEIYLGRADTIDLGEAASGESSDYVAGFLSFCDGGGFVELTNVEMYPVSAGSVNVPAGGSYVFTAYLDCDWGPCPSGATFSWSLDKPIGTLNSSTSNPVVFTAGITAGQVIIHVQVSLGQITMGASKVIYVAT